MINIKTIRIFLISMLLVFLMVVIPHLIPKPSWVSPAPKPEQKNEALQKIGLRLETKQTSFKLKKELMPAVLAGSDYDQAAAYGVVDFETGDILSSKDLSTKLPIASLTKVMTAIVALDLADPSEKFVVSKNAAMQIPSKVMLKEGETYSLQHLLFSLLISSANDSAEVIKEGIDQKIGQQVFIAAMNYKAKVLGLKNTHFTNAQGFDNPLHYSSIEDLIILSHYSMKNYPIISEIVKKSFEDLTNNNTDKRFYLNNWNGLLETYPGVSGIKIGNTGDSGNCTIVLSERKGKKILAVLLGAPGVLERDLWTSQLLDLGFSKVAGLAPVNLTEDQLRAKYASWKFFE